MKQILNFLLIAGGLALFILLPFHSFAQVVDTTGAGGIFDTLPDAEGLLNIYNAIYGAMVILWGFAAKAFGLKTKVKSFVFVVIAGGLVIAGGFVAFGLVDFLPLAITLIGSLGLYDIFKGLKKTAKKE